MLKGLQYGQSRVPEVLPRLCNLSGRGEQSQTTAVEQDKSFYKGQTPPSRRPWEGTFMVTWRYRLSFALCWKEAFFSF